MRGRGDRLAALLAERELDRMLVTDLVNVRYLTGFTGTNGACVCGPEHAPLPHRLPLHRARRGRGRGLGDGHGRRRLARRDRRAARRAGSASRTTTCRSARWSGWRRNSPTGSSWSPPAATVEQLRRVKDEAELAAIAGGLEARRRGLALERSSAASPAAPSARSPAPPKRGSASSAAEPSFPAIVAAGPNGALPHAEPGEREIGARRAGRLRHGRQARRLLLRRHPHLRHRRARRGRRARSTRSVLRRPAGGARGGRGRRRAARTVDARRPRDDRRRRPRRALRPRPRPRRRARGARGRRGSRRAPTTCSRPAKW